MATELPYDLTRLARWCAGLLTALLALEVLFGLSLIYSIVDVNRALSGETIETVMFLDEESWRSDVAITAVSIVYGLAFVTALISNGIWIYRASANAGAIAPSETRIKPGWAVGWYFVPFANLWMPYRAMSETWEATMDVSGAQEAGVPRWFAGWWACWVIANILSTIADNALGDNYTLEDVVTSNTIYLVNGVLSLVAIYLFRRIIREVSEAQALSGRRLEEVFA